MRIIRRVTLGLPMKHKRDPTLYLGGFLEFLKEKLPNLSELILTTEFGARERPFVRNGVNTRIGEEYRAMLNTSAWVTYKHPRLKKAIWLVESGGVVFVSQLRNVEADDVLVAQYENNAESSHNSNVDSSATVSNNVEAGTSTGETVQSVVADGNSGDVPDTGLADNLSNEIDFEEDMTDQFPTYRLTVKILSEDRRFKVRTEPRIDLVPQIKRVMASDIIIDSQAVRRTEWSDLHAPDPRNFALTADATTSEPPKPVVSRRYDGLMYANYQVLCDYLRDQFKYLSMKDKNRVTPKGVIRECAS